MGILNKYEKQAADFLDKHGLIFRVQLCVPNECPQFCDGKHIHGDKYWVTLERRVRKGSVELVDFPFWNSMNDKEKSKRPRPYDVLACVSGAVNCPDTFKGFCDEYGYDEDSRQAEKTFRGCIEFCQKLRAFFSDAEIEDLSLIS